MKTLPSQRRKSIRIDGRASSNKKIEIISNISKSGTIKIQGIE